MQAAQPATCFGCDEPFGKTQAIHQPGGEGHPMHSVCLEMMLKVSANCPLCNQPTKDLATRHARVIHPPGIAVEDDSWGDYVRCRAMVGMLKAQYKELCEKNDPEQQEVLKKLVPIAALLRRIGCSRLEDNSSSDRRM